MAKAVLVMDMPESCFGCNLCHIDYEEDRATCQAYETAKEVNSNIFEKPEWRPLRELPKRKEELPVEKYEFGGLGKAFTSGWNTCLDEFLKESR
jgi:hypothetical protein